MLLADHTRSVLEDVSVGLRVPGPQGTRPWDSGAARSSKRSEAPAVGAIVGRRLSPRRSPPKVAAPAAHARRLLLGDPALPRAVLEVLQPVARVIALVGDQL